MSQSAIGFEAKRQWPRWALAAFSLAWFLITLVANSQLPVHWLPNQTGLAAGATRLFLEVADDNVAARGLYERTGFDPIGRRKAYYAGADGSRTDAVVMSRDLCAPDANLTLP